MASLEHDVLGIIGTGGTLDKARLIIDVVTAEACTEAAQETLAARAATAQAAATQAALDTLTAAITDTWETCGLGDAPADPRQALQGLAKAVRATGTPDTTRELAEACAQRDQALQQLATERAINGAQAARVPELEARIAELRHRTPAPQPATPQQIAAACGVTPQAVYNWARKRPGNGYPPAIARQGRTELVDLNAATTWHTKRGSSS